MKITLVLDVPKLTNVKDGKKYATLLAENIVLSDINDDCSIKSVLSSVKNVEQGRA